MSHYYRIIQRKLFLVWPIWQNVKSRNTSVNSKIQPDNNWLKSNFCGHCLNKSLSICFLAKYTYIYKHEYVSVTEIKNIFWYVSVRSINMGELASHFDISIVTVNIVYDTQNLLCVTLPENFWIRFLNCDFSCEI